MVDTTVASGLHAEESLTPMVKSDIVQNHSSMMAKSSNGCETSIGQTKKMGRPLKSSVVTQCPVSDGSHIEDTLMTLDRAYTAPIHSTRMETMSNPRTSNLGYLAKPLGEAECPVFDGSRADEPSITLGKAETKDDKASIGLVLSNYVLSISRTRTKDLGIQDGDEGGQVDCASDIQGIDTSHQANQLLVLALTEVDVVSADIGLGNGDSLSPLMTINPLGLVVSAELNSKSEVMGFDNTLNISNWVNIESLVSVS